MKEKEEKIVIRLNLSPQKDEVILKELEGVPEEERPQVLQELLRDYLEKKEKYEIKRRAFYQILHMVKLSLSEIEENFTKETDPPSPTNIDFYEEEKERGIEERVDRLIDLF